jgi:hypothetical protein
MVDLMSKWARVLDCTEKPEGEEIAVTITFEAGGRNDLFVRKVLSSSNSTAFLCLKAAEIAQLLENQGVDLEYYLAKYSLDEYKRAESILWQ